MLRQVVERSLDEFVQFFSLYEVRICTTVVRTCVHSLYKHIQQNSAQHIPCGLVARIRRSHRRGPGSIPGTGVIFTFFFPLPYTFQTGNAFEGEFQDMTFVFQPPINQKLVLRGAELLPTPSFDDIEAVMCTCIDAIVESAQGIQRVSTPQAHSQLGPTDAVFR